jgi:hypothetical protein
MKRAFLCAALVAYATRSLGEVPVQKVRWQFCEAAAPEGWTVSTQIPTETAFGAGLTRLDGAASATYLLFGVAPQVGSSAHYQQWYATPERAVIGQLTQFGSKPMSCNRPAELMAGSGYMGMTCHSHALEGVVAYKVFGAVESGYAVLMRTASGSPATWNRYGTEATAVARSVQCQVPLLPSRTKLDMPSPPKRGNRGQEGAESEYSPWLGMEHFHDAKTGQNYWVSPTRDWDETGPQGPGYYTKIGNDTRKLEPGLSQ